MEQVAVVEHRLGGCRVDAKLFGEDGRQQDHARAGGARGAARAIECGGFAQHADDPAEECGDHPRVALREVVAAHARDRPTPAEPRRARIARGEQQVEGRREAEGEGCQHNEHAIRDADRVAQSMLPLLWRRAPAQLLRRAGERQPQDGQQWRRGERDQDGELRGGEVVLARVGSRGNMLFEAVPVCQLGCVTPCSRASSSCASGCET